MLREWLTDPDRLLWTFGVLPMSAFIVYLALMGIRWRKRGDRPRRMIRWALPALILVCSYYMWGFEVPLAQAVLVAGGGAVLMVVGTLMQDAVYMGTQRSVSRIAGGETKPGDGSVSAASPEQAADPGAGRQGANGD